MSIYKTTFTWKSTNTDRSIKVSIQKDVLVLKFSSDLADQFRKTKSSKFSIYIDRAQKDLRVDIKQLAEQVCCFFGLSFAECPLIVKELLAFANRLTV